MNHNLPKLRPIPMKERLSMIFVGKGRVDVLDGAFVVVDERGVRKHIPVGKTACILLEPGTRVSHAAVTLASQVGTLLVWVGEGGVRLYSSGQPGGARSDRLLYQAQLALDESARLRVVRYMYELRFSEKPPQRRSIQQLRGIEGARVREMYKQLGRQFGIKWEKRKYDPKNWDSSDPVNKAVSAANACLYGITEAAILAAGYAPAVGFIHTGKPQSFVYDIADLFKFETSIPVAFRIASRGSHYIEHDVRKACRDDFRKAKLLKRIIPTIEKVLAAGKLPKPDPETYSVGPAFPTPENIGDAGHRS